MGNLLKTHIQHLVITGIGVKPTFPHPDLRPGDETWKENDIMKGEWCLNETDNIWYYNNGTSIEGMTTGALLNFSSFFKVTGNAVDLAAHHIALPDVKEVDIASLDVQTSAGLPSLTHTFLNGLYTINNNALLNWASGPLTLLIFDSNIYTMIPKDNKVRVSFRARLLNQPAVDALRFSISLSHHSAFDAVTFASNDIPSHDWTNYTVEADFAGILGKDADVLKIQLEITTPGAFPSGCSFEIDNLSITYFKDEGLPIPVANLLLKSAGLKPTMAPDGLNPGDEGYDISRHIKPGQLAINAVDKKLFYNNGSVIDEFSGNTDSNITVDAIPTKDSTNPVASGGVYKSIKETILVESLSDYAFFSCNEDFKVTAVSAATGLTISLKKSDDTAYTLGDTITGGDFLKVFGDTLNKTATIKGEII